MFRNKFLGGISYLPLLKPDDGTGSEKTPEQLRQEERDKINVDVAGTMNNGSDDDKSDIDDKSAKDGDDEDSEEASDEEEDEEAEDEDKDPPADETEEQKKERIAKEKEDRKQARINKRIGKYKSERDELAEKVAKLEAQLAEKPGDEKLTEEEVERRAELKAAEKLLAKNEEKEKEAFTNDKLKIEKQGLKKDPAFVENILEAAEEFGKIPKDMIGILANELDYDNGGEVLAYLAMEDNREEYGEIIELNPIRMAKRLEKISNKLHEEAVAAKNKKKPKLSEAPPPIKPVRESNGALPLTLTGKESTEDYVRIRNAQIEARRKAQGFR